MPDRLTVAFILALFAAPAPAGPPVMDDLSWLSGCWGSVGAEPGAGEFWTPLAGDSLFGISRTVREGRTVAHEFLQIRPGADGRIALTALPSGQAETRFPLVDLANGKAVFENPEHDFPQRIGYQRAGADSLSAWIEGTASSGETRRIDFPMTRHDCDAVNATTTP